MRKYFSKYSLELVKEDETKYENRIREGIDAYNAFLDVFKLDKKPEEHLVMLCLTCKNQILGAFEVAKGKNNECFIEPGEIIVRALLCNAKKIIIAHNHPSGDSTPSGKDYKMTDRIKQACEIIGIELLDHLVIAEDGFNSADIINKK